MRILFVKTSSLGDVIHHLPVVNDILRHHPDAHIDWVVEESFADIPRLHPHVHQVLTVAIRRWRKQLFNSTTWQEIQSFKQAIQASNYDAVIDTQGLIKSALITKLASGPKHGYDKSSIREPIASYAYQHRYHISYQQHAVARNRILTAQALGYSIPTDLPDYGVSANTTLFPMTVTLPQQPFVMALHGTSRDSKLWPTEQWVALGKALAQQDTALVLPWASPAEKIRAESIQSQLSNATVLPKLSIGQLASVISQARAAIGVDTGLSHLAVALSIPTVAIYTDTNPALTGVMAGAHAPAINLGNIHQSPPTTAVLEAYQQIAR